MEWSASMQIYWNKGRRLHKKRVKLPQDLFGTPTWPPFHCFGTPIWPPWRHVKTLYAKGRQRGRQNACVWQTWQAYFVGVLWWSSPNLMFSNLLQKDLFRGGWSSAEKFFKQNYSARSIQPNFPEISVQNSMDRFGPTGKVSKKQVHLLRWSSFPGRTGWNFGWMDRAHCHACHPSCCVSGLLSVL